MKKSWPIFAAACYYLIAAKPVFSAFSFSIKEVDKSSLSHKEEEVKIILTINELPSESYFRVAFQPKNGGTYFGYLKNENGEWVKIRTLSSGDCSGYYHITDTSATELTINLIIGGENEINSEEYLIKGHRFTVSCPKSGYTESSNSVPINFSFPSPATNPSPSPAANSSPDSSTSSDSNQIPSPAMSPPLTSPSPTPSPPASPRIREIALLNRPTPEPVLGTASAQPAENKSQPDKQLIIMLLATGTGLVSTAAIIIIRLWHQS